MSIVISPSDGNRKCIFLTIIDDFSVEDVESFRLTLSSSDPSVVATDSATVSILDNDQLILAIELPSYTVLESAGAVEVRVLISEGELQRDVSIMLNTQDGSAAGKSLYLIVAILRQSIFIIYIIQKKKSYIILPYFLSPALGGQDYSPLSGFSLTFPSGSGVNNVLSFNVSITDDSLLENNEFFSVHATSMDPVVTFSPGRNTSTVNILDDDSVTVSIELDNYSIREGDGLLEVCLVVSDDLGRDVTININSMDLTAEGKNIICILAVYLYCLQECHFSY